MISNDSEHIDGDKRYKELEYSTRSGVHQHIILLFFIDHTIFHVELNLKLKRITKKPIKKLKINFFKKIIFLILQFQTYYVVGRKPTTFL